MTRAIPTPKTAATHIATIFIENWVMLYGIRRNILSDNGPQSVGKFFSALCGYLGFKKLETTAYHPQKNGQNERYNNTIIARMRHYIAEHPANWNTYIQPLTYAYSNQFHRSTGLKPFDLVLCRSPTDPTMTIIPTALPSEITTAMPTGQLQQVLLRRLVHMATTTNAKLSKSQPRYKRYFDNKSCLSDCLRRPVRTKSCPQPPKRLPWMKPVYRIPYT